MKKILIFMILGCLLLTSCQSEEVIVCYDTHSDEWGLELSSENVTESGLTLVFTQSGGGKTGELQTGEWYSLDKNVDGEWIPLETEPLDFAWNMVAYMIKENDITKLDVNWEWLYGILPSGKYRINKVVMDFRQTGDYDEKIYSAEFEVKERKAFLATVIDETTKYMIAEPESWEEERKLFDRIKVVYTNDHYDFLYGKERKVVIYYDGEIDEKGVIKTDDISTGGFRNFELLVVPSDDMTKKQIIKKAEPTKQAEVGYYYGDVNLYYYGVENVYVDVDGAKIPYDVAIKQGKLSSYAIVAKANSDVQNGIIEEIVYDDGGSQIYKYPEYTIIKYHTLDGNRDVYIGTTDMDISVKDR